MFFKGTVTIYWRKIILVVKLAHSEPGRVVRADAFVCSSVCKCAWFVSSTWWIHASLLFLHIYMFLCIETNILCTSFHGFCQKILISFSGVFFCLCMCVCLRSHTRYIIAKSPSSMMGSKWPTVVHSKQQRLAAFEDRVLSEHRKTFLSLLMYLWWWLFY